MRRRTSGRAERGSATLELILAVGFLLIPATALLAQLPSWIASGHAAHTAAIEAARQVVLADDMAGGVAAAQGVAYEVVVNHGFAAADVLDLTVAADPPGDLQRGQIVTVTVTLRGHPIIVPALGAVGNPFDASGSATERVDDYRSLP